MATEIYDQTHGPISSYPLLDEIQTTHHLTRQEAHDAIHAMLDDVIIAKGEVLLAASGAYWLVSDETADEIRDGVAAMYA